MLHYLARARESNEQKGGKGGKKSGEGVDINQAHVAREAGAVCQWVHAT